ncbi:Rap1a/Tai family immunity protein [Dechloromonas sp. A34]|uniref:Rap1a/Tai family immunity protein n=1 Tax=Dechloromonas sp. A34 TaxID=447588 RepID=UPI00224936C1|nr:Rap1a/Tai family immunity protein [Dechloromonas sp. A34]
MKKIFRIVLSIVALLFASQAPALTDRAHLEKWCTHGSQVAAGRCIGYLLAAEDALSTAEVEGVRACVPRDVTLQQLHQALIEWLATHPDAAGETALGLVARAYAERFPCGK